MGCKSVERLGSERNDVNGEVFIPLGFVEAARKQELCAVMCTHVLLHERLDEKM